MTNSPSALRLRPRQRVRRSGPGQSPPSLAPGSASRDPAPGDRWRLFCCGASSRGSFTPPLDGLLLVAFIGIALSITSGIPAATIAARESGRHDPQFVVIDEVAGQWIALLGSPADFRHGVIAFILFRLFDITKPFPVRRLEKLPEGWGIVFDDVAAGLYALGVASVLRLWIH